MKMTYCSGCAKGMMVVEFEVLFRSLPEWTKGKRFQPSVSS